MKQTVFEDKIIDQWDAALDAGEKSVDLTALQIHNAVTPVQEGRNWIPIVCNAMRKLMRDGDELLERAPKGDTTRYRVRYKIPRSRN